MNIIWLLCALFPIQAVAQNSVNLPVDKQLRFMLKGRDGSEKVKITVGGVTKEFTLKKEWQAFTYPKPANGQFSVDFFNDGGSRDVLIKDVTPELSPLLPDFRANDAWKCGSTQENSRCKSLRGGWLAWNGVYTYHFKGELAYSKNCNCGTRVKEFAQGKNTTGLCRNACQAVKNCKSFGVWTKQSHSAGYCALFDKVCTPKCPNPTNTPGGWFNEVFNRNADEVSENNVITWLKILIDEGLNEIDLINDKVNASEANLALVKSNFNTARVAEEVARAKKDNAFRALQDATGKCNAIQAEYSRIAPGLRTEIATFNKVILTLQTLLPGGKGLVEENHKVDVTSFISLADQADPTKVRTVINLVTGLKAASQKQLNDITNALTTCRKEVAAKNNEYVRLRGLWDQAVANKNAKKKILDAAQGQHDTLVAHASRRIPVVEKEVEDLRNVISLLTTLL